MLGNTTINTTGAKDIPLKLTGKRKWQVSAGLTTALNENFKHCCVVATSSNGWTNEELTLLYLKGIMRSFTLQKRLLA